MEGPLVRFAGLSLHRGGQRAAAGTGFRAFPRGKTSARTGNAFSRRFSYPRFYTVYTLCGRDVPGKTDTQGAERRTRREPHAHPPALWHASRARPYADTRKHTDTRTRTPARPPAHTPTHTRDRRAILTDGAAASSLPSLPLRSVTPARAARRTMKFRKTT